MRLATRVPSSSQAELAPSRVWMRRAYAWVLAFGPSWVPGGLTGSTTSLAAPMGNWGERGWLQRGSTSPGVGWIRTHTLRLAVAMLQAMGMPEAPAVGKHTVVSALAQMGVGCVHKQQSRQMGCSPVGTCVRMLSICSAGSACDCMRDLWSRSSRRSCGRMHP